MLKLHFYNHKTLHHLKKQSFYHCCKCCLCKAYSPDTFQTHLVYTKCVRKETRLVSQKLYFNLKSIITQFSFKIVSLKSNTLFHSFLPCIYGSLEGFFWSHLQFYGHGPFDGFHISKMGSFNDFL